ncbi:ABC transporter substrate-binding protein [Martelella radicis]|uniref:Iron(III) transport system substrate-binding protein n=1 Tax=Martelella radicis TaxID=1397476 RepID=A0A7W6KNS1_9HYPH|nr:extracellular solute-binding protein [Martelella radicis]MBB4124694.1 iron(III) transport system substrate-binding protein [Martelella radicis]
MKIKSMLKAGLAASALAISSASAVSAAEIVVYTNWVIEETEAFEAAFEAEHPDIDVVFFRAPIEELFTTIDLEVQTGQLRADVIIFGDTTRATALAESGILGPLELSEEAKAAIDDSLLDPNGIIAPYMLQPVVVQYNTNAVPDDIELDSWNDLLDDRFKGRVALGDPRVTGMVHPALWTLASYLSEEDGFGWPFVEKLAAQQPRLATGHRGIRDLVALGEVSIAIQTVDNAVESVAQGEPTNYYYPVEGTPVLYQSIGVVAGSGEAEAARTFALWMVGPEGQRLVNAEIGALPVRGDVPIEKGETIDEMRKRANVVVMGPELTQEVRQEQAVKFYDYR